MFRNRKNQSGVTLIADGAEFEGNLQFSGELFVYGRILGNVTGLDGEAKITLGQSGVIEGDVRVSTVVIDGTIKGEVYAAAKVELAERAVVEGSVHYTLIQMHLGARIDGQLVHARDANVAGETNVLPLPERKVIDG
jgi:cytoskeletal protein CcmA (bactofilin family)